MRQPLAILSSTVDRLTVSFDHSVILADLNFTLARGVVLQSLVRTAPARRSCSGRS